MIRACYTLSFPIGLVKTESDFIVRFVETDLGAMNAAGSCDRGGPLVSLVTTDEFSVRVTKITSRISVL